MFRKLSLMALFAAAILPFSANAQLKYVEGQDYIVLETPIETTDKPKVIEFFWFGCPHCNNLRPAVNDWLKEGFPEDMEFEFIPAYIDSEMWQRPARAYYTMKALKLDLFDAYFEEIFTERNRGMLGSDSEIKAFFVRNGISSEDFDKAWNSFEVKQQLQRAENLFDKTGLDGVPAFVVNGKYIVHPAGDGKSAYGRSFDIIESLAK